MLQYDQRGFMKESLNDLVKIISKYTPTDGFHDSPIKGVYCTKYSNQDKRTRRHWRACFAIIVQGCKEVTLEHDRYRACVGHYSVSPVDLPVVSRIAMATPEKPFLGILINFNSPLLTELVSEMDGPGGKENSEIVSGILVGKANEKMLETAARLVKLFDNKDEAKILAPLIIKELFYYLLIGPHGEAIKQFVLSGSKLQRVSKVIHEIRSDLTEEINVIKLSKQANMSRAAFFKCFKEITSLSPIQYQKKLRLIEARRVMMNEGESAERAAFRVGYNSASQFNREYSRMFGNSPLRDVSKIKESGSMIRQI